MEQTLSAYTEAINRALYETALLQNAQGVSAVTETSPSDDTVPEPLKSAMRYSLTLPGKRLRPTLLLAAYRLLEEDWQSAMSFAIALEMIHAYSLIHDDLPALDNDDLRRGQPTNHKAFGENMAILAGDGLYSLAFETMLSASLKSEHPKRAVAAMEEIARRAGVRGMIAGQTLDVKLEGTKPCADTVRYIHRHKTADLITAAIVAGLLLAGADERQRRAGEIYGQALGMAFQIVDDLLDVQGDVEILGKQTGMDAQRGKMTWPTVYGVDASRKAAENYVDQAVEALSGFGSGAKFLCELARQTLTRVS
ncbi:MAG: polyprenyl synthetase family protein [Eubacteriales bacterium]|nr:polyprenyl synthetase family protein [Eubacteriales bacterium]